MNREDLESLLVDYIDGKLNDTDRKSVELELARNEESYRVYEQLVQVIKAMDNVQKFEPDPRLKRKFDEALSDEVAKDKKAKVVSFHFNSYRIAAGVLIVMSMLLIGHWVNRNYQQEKELAALRKEMQITKQLMMSMIDNPESASQRMKGVNVALGIEKADDDVIQALAKAMNEDRNTNVRLAALEALSKFRHEAPVRKILIDALAKQNDPVVQIALIQMLVQMKESGVVNELHKIIDDDETIQAVKDEAYTGIIKLS